MSSDRCVGLRIQPHVQTPSAASLQLAVGRRGLGPRDQEEQRTQRASFVATHHTRVHTAAAAAAAGYRAGLGCLVEKNTA